MLQQGLGQNVVWEGQNTGNVILTSQPAASSGYTSGLSTGLDTTGLTGLTTGAVPSVGMGSALIQSHSPATQLALIPASESTQLYREGVKSPYWGVVPDKLPKKKNGSYYDLPPQLRDLSPDEIESAIETGYVDFEDDNERLGGYYGHTQFPLAEEEEHPPVQENVFPLTKLRLIVKMQRYKEKLDEGPACQLHSFCLYDPQGQPINLQDAVVTCGAGRQVEGQEPQGLVIPSCQFGRLYFGPYPLEIDIDLRQQHLVSSYGWRTAFDLPGRDPTSWTLLGELDEGMGGTSMVVLDKVENFPIPDRRNEPVGPRPLTRGLYDDDMDMSVYSEGSGSSYSPRVVPNLGPLGPGSPAIVAEDGPGTPLSGDPGFHERLQNHMQDQGNKTPTELLHHVYPTGYEPATSGEQPGVYYAESGRTVLPPYYTNHSGGMAPGQEDASRDLFKLVSEGCHVPNPDREINNLLARGADVNYKGDDKGRTPLTRAVGMCPTFIAKQLIQAGADVNAKATTTGETPLHRLALTSTEHRCQTAAEVLNAHANPNARDVLGDTPLSLAAARGDPDMTKTLLEWGADKTIPNNAGHTPEQSLLQRLSKKEHLPRANETLALLKGGVTPNIGGQPTRPAIMPSPMAPIHAHATPPPHAYGHPHGQLPLKQQVQQVVQAGRRPQAQQPPPFVPPATTPAAPPPFQPPTRPQAHAQAAPPPFQPPKVHKVEDY